MKIKNIRDTLLGPVEIFLHLLGGFHTIREVGPRGSKAALSERLQFQEFAVLSIELARTGKGVSE